MKIYFLSSVPCALFLNDLYFGITDRFERFADITLSDKIFARFAPQGALPIGFFIDENILSTPPDGCEIYIVKDGIAIFAKDFPPTDLSLKLISQKRVDNTLVTLFKQGSVQLSVESPNGYFNTTLPPSFENGRLLFQNDLCVIHTENQLALYTRECKRLLLEEILDFSIENDTLQATLPLCDHLKRIAVCSWALTPTSCTQTEFLIKQSTEVPLSTPEDLLAYAFFESFLIGADATEFLSEDLRSQTAKIKAFLGEFTAVLPTEDKYTCALIKRKKERLFEAVYYRVTIENGKIVDVQG